MEGYHVPGIDPCAEIRGRFGRLDPISGIGRCGVHCWHEMTVMGDRGHISWVQKVDSAILPAEMYTDPSSPSGQSGTLLLARALKWRVASVASITRSVRILSFFLKLREINFDNEWIQRTVRVTCRLHLDFVGSQPHRNLARPSSEAFVGTHAGFRAGAAGQLAGIR